MVRPAGERTGGGFQIHVIAMLHHLSLAVIDLARSAVFYDAALGPLGYGRVWADATAVGYGLPGGGDKFAIKLSSGPVAAPGPGFHIAFAAPSRKPWQVFTPRRSGMADRTTARLSSAPSTRRELLRRICHRPGRLSHRGCDQWSGLTTKNLTDEKERRMPLGEFLAELGLQAILPVRLLRHHLLARLSDPEDSFAGPTADCTVLDHFSRTQPRLEDRLEYLNSRHRGKALKADCACLVGLLSLVAAGVALYFAG